MAEPHQDHPHAAARSPEFNALRGVAKLWLRAHQPQHAKRIEGCPTVHIDLHGRRACFGNALADRWQAEVIALAGIWVPDGGRFDPAHLDPQCPDFLVDRLGWCLSREPLKSLPEATQATWMGCAEDDAWTWAALLGEGCAAASVQASAAHPGAVFLLLEEVAPIPSSQRKFTPDYLQDRLRKLALPVVNAFWMALARSDERPGADEADQQDEVIDLSFALRAAESLVATMRECAGELEREAPTMTGIFTEPANRLDASLALVARAFEAGEGADAADGLAEISVVLSALVPELSGPE